MDEQEILQKAISTFGAEEQERVAIEECAELIQAISHKHRNRSHNISEEIADVEIMLAQLKIINDCEEHVQLAKRAKLHRLLRRLKDD